MDDTIYGSDSDSLRKAAQEVTASRPAEQPLVPRDAPAAVGAPRAPEPPIEVLDSRNLADKIDPDTGENRGLDWRDAAASLSLYREQKAAKAQEFDRSVHGEPEPQAPDEPLTGYALDEAIEKAQAALRALDGDSNVTAVRDAHAALEQAHARRDEELTRAEKIIAEAKAIEQREAQQATATIQQSGPVEQQLAAQLDAVRREAAQMFPEIKSQADIDFIQRTNPARYQSFTEYANLAGQILQQQQQVSAQRIVAQDTARRSFEVAARQHDDKFNENKPELKNAAYRDAAEKEAVALCREWGLSDEQMLAAYRGEIPNLPLRDYRVQNMIYAQVRERLRAKTPKPRAIPPVLLRPGTGGEYVSAAEAGVAALERQMDRSPNPRNAARLLTAVRKARR